MVFAVRGDEIRVIVRSGEGEGMCCPTQFEDRTYIWDQARGILVQTRTVTISPEARDRLVDSLTAQGFELIQP
jgi:hypothetical protein